MGEQLECVVNVIVGEMVDDQIETGFRQKIHQRRKNLIEYTSTFVPTSQKHVFFSYHMFDKTPCIHPKYIHRFVS